MMTLAPERSWLLDRGLLKLVHQCRKLILAEFGVKLHLTDDHLEHRLADYAEKSRSNHLTRTWNELRQHLPDAGDNDTPRRMYRGQELAEPAPPAEKEATEESGRTRTITYRGRKVEVPA